MSNALTCNQNPSSLPYESFLSKSLGEKSKGNSDPCFNPFNPFPAVDNDFRMEKKKTSFSESDILNNFGYKFQNLPIRVNSDGHLFFEEIPEQELGFGKKISLEKSSELLKSEDNKQEATKEAFVPRDLSVLKDSLEVEQFQNDPPVVSRWNETKTRDVASLLSTDSKESNNPISPKRSLFQRAFSNDDFENKKNKERKKDNRISVQEIGYLASKKNKRMTLSAIIPNLQLTFDTISCLEKKHIRISFVDQRSQNMMLIKISCDKNSQVISKEDLIYFIFNEQLEILRFYPPNSGNYIIIAFSQLLKKIHVTVTYPANEFTIGEHKGEIGVFDSIWSDEYTLFRKKQYELDLQNTWIRNVVTRSFEENSNFITSIKIDNNRGVTLGYSPGRKGQLLIVVDPTMCHLESKTLTSIRDLTGDDLDFILKLKTSIERLIRRDKLLVINPGCQPNFYVPYPPSVHVFHIIVNNNMKGMTNNNIKLDDIIVNLQRNSKYYQEAVIKVQLNNYHPLRKLFLESEG